jgi:GntR family transcriptional regulator
MFFALDASNGIAMYEQIVRQAKFAIASGAIQPGEMIPSVRELARELTLNPNTVARAYRQLQQEGILETVRGTGLQVAAGATRLCADARLKLVRARLKQVFQEAKQSRIDLKQLRGLIDRELSAFEREGL